MKKIAVAFGFCLLATIAWAVTNTFVVTVNVTFTPLHTYFMAATGCNDANAGTSAGSPWCTPNHAVVCGDVIIAAAGNYSATSFDTNWGTVSTCPSTTGGIDGAGGVYFAILLCGGADLEACHSSGQLWDIPKSNWAVEGWKVSNHGGGSTNRAFNSDGCSAIIHHLAFINNVAFDAASGYHTDDCGGGAGLGVDYWAVVGSIAQNAAQNTSFPEAAIDDVGPGAFDTNAGTHALMYGNFTWNNTAATQTPFDTEAMMFDSWDARAYSNTGVIANNVAWRSWRYCIQVIASGTVTDSPVMKWYNNTCYGNDQSTGTDSADGEINIALGKNWSLTITNNIAQATSATSPGGGNTIYGLVNGGGLNSGTTVSGNVLKGVSGNDFALFNGNTIGTNVTGVDPGFANTTDLLANHMGAPSCSGFINVTACMGYNAGTQVLTSLSVISDLTPDPNCGSVTNQCAGKGYQLPSTTCVTSGSIHDDYPTWLKGIVYLHWDGSIITRKTDLVTLPCGM